MPGQKIKTIFAFVCENADGDEGIVSTPHEVQGTLFWMPIVGADMARVTSLVPIAQEISAISGRPFRILKFDTVTDITDVVLEMCRIDRETDDS